MAFILEQRRHASAIPFVRQWSECAGSKRETREEVEAEQPWWMLYDEMYGLSGWEYRIREVRK